MKLLKLDARFEDARRVARCLVGSNCAVSKIGALSNRFGFELVQQLQDGLIVCHYNQVRKWESMTPVNFIILPIDILKFCPFMAMRERVQVIGEDSCTLSHDRITQAQILGNHETFVVSKWRYAIGEISLDLGPIERGELEGCEIVGIS